MTPEVQAQFQRPVGRFAPYVGLGAGALVSLPSDVQTERESLFSLSAAAGARTVLTERVGVVAELRLRGADRTDRGFAHSAAEWTAGLAWRF
jgi:opacity protein-like surface antigen